jgi:hypothetical protein
MVLEKTDFNPKNSRLSVFLYSRRPAIEYKGRV